MPRRKAVVKREKVPDHKFKDLLTGQFINCIMRRGKKSLAERVFYNALDIVTKKTNQTGLSVFKKALENVRPILEVKPRRVGGATYQVPVEVRPERSTALAMRWIIGYAKDRGEHSMAEKLAGELISASKNEGASIKKREDTHRMAEANKAFAHFRW
ncbi:30S ribosomal protein S7 [candidate division WOR-1 bacterium DG_54_3]|uniref:Small ribosomal subunit protein uS7 n=1 Tax=candidate division WOR-1 bacterium DG_54_3 TaxID=1703775 RepID=A0A0S7Y2Z6_UNCSA|nr:MAG: 30S ribosomal protein S7 [candidate division WOR-1 bacterium DG_54_3]